MLSGLEYCTVHTHASLHVVVIVGQVLDKIKQQWCHLSPVYQALCLTMLETVTLGACAVTAVSLSLLFYINTIFAPDKLDSFALHSVDNSIVVLHSTYCPWWFFFHNRNTLCQPANLFRAHLCGEVD